VPHSKFHALCLCLCGGKTLSTGRTAALKPKSLLSGPHGRHFWMFTGWVLHSILRPPRIPAKPF
jgi:hypothetical protein